MFTPMIVKINSAIIVILLLFARSSFCPEIKNKLKENVNPIRQNFNSIIEELLVDQVNLKYTSFYAYQTMAAYFNRPDVAMLGYYKYFLGKSNEKLSHARNIISFINKRGGTFTSKIIFPYWPKLQQNVRKPNLSSFQINWNGEPNDALESAIQLEQYITDKFISISNESIRLKDPATKEFLKSFIKEEIESIKNLQILLSRLKSSKIYEVAEFLTDQELLGGQ